jgi:Na+/glutamate symporter
MDSNDTDGTSMACAHAIGHALSQLFGWEENILAILFGQATDSGGGGTGNSFFKELTKLGLSSSAESYLKSFCTLHCIQLHLQNPIS